MAQVTTNTEINTINILQEATFVNDTDLFLLQRGSQTLKLQKSNLTFPLGNLERISDNTVLGNISGTVSTPYEIDLLRASDNDSNRDDALVTEKRIKNYISASSGAAAYVPINAISEFNQGDGQIITYDIRNFNGSGYNSDRVVGIYLECYSAKNRDGVQHVTSIQSQLGNGYGWVTIQITYDHEDATTGGLRFIPLSLGQKTFNLRLTGQPGEINDSTEKRGWKIVGVSQY